MCYRECTIYLRSQIATSNKKRRRYGDIIGRYVIYRGENAKATGVQYLNVEDYLKSLTE